MVTNHGAPCRQRPTYNGVQPGSPRESFAILLSLLQCHAAFSMIPSTLAWVDQSPVSQRVVVTLYRVSCTPFTASHFTQGTDRHITLRDR